MQFLCTARTIAKLIHINSPGGSTSARWKLKHLLQTCVLILSLTLKPLKFLQSVNPARKYFAKCDVLLFETRCISLRQDRCVFFLCASVTNRPAAKSTCQNLRRSPQPAEKSSVIGSTEYPFTVIGIVALKFASHIVAAPPPLLEKAYRYPFRLLPNQAITIPAKAVWGHLTRITLVVDYNVDYRI